MRFYKREAAGQLTHTDRKGEGNMTMEAETRVISYKPRHAGSHQKLEEKHISNLVCQPRIIDFLSICNTFFPDFFLSQYMLPQTTH